VLVLDFKVISGTRFVKDNEEPIRKLGFAARIPPSGRLLLPVNRTVLDAAALRLQKAGEMRPEDGRGPWPTLFTNKLREILRRLHLSVKWLASVSQRSI